MVNIVPSIVKNAKLPSPSPVINQVLELLYTPDTEIDDLIDAMKGDSSLSAKVLRSANSAMSSPVKKVDDLKDAVLRIGLIPTINIITAAEIVNIFYSVPLPYGDAFKLWEHNVTVACLSEAYAKHLNLTHPGRWFSAGLMHDIGRLLLIQKNPTKYGEIVNISKTEGSDLIMLEEQHMGFSHSDIGGILLQHWDMPDDLSTAAFDHHNPFRSVDLYGSGVGLCDRIANDLMGADTPTLTDISIIPVEKLVAGAAEMYEKIKNASGLPHTRSQ